MIYYATGQWYGGGLITIVNYASTANTQQVTNGFLYLDNTPFELLDNNQLLLLEAP